MKYIILAAGKGTRLHPITLSSPKSLYKLDDSTTVMRRMVNLIRQHDSKSDIYAVDGFMFEQIEAEIPDLTFIRNPFYAITNSIASLWFARDILTSGGQIAIINADIVIDSEMTKNFLCAETDRPIVLLDSSIKRNGDYNVQVNGDNVVIMSKEIDNYFGEYAGITILDEVSAGLLRSEIEVMVNTGLYDQWYENALVQMIFARNFSLYWKDVSECKWTEVDCADDLLFAKKIHLEDNFTTQKA